MINSRVLSISLILIAAVYCLPADKNKKTTKDNICKPEFCALTKFGCSCNSTQVLSKDSCTCCPPCQNYIEEGDRCTVPDGGELPPGENSTTVGNNMNKEIIKSEEKVNKGKECRPGLICLLGTCVTLF